MKKILVVDDNAYILDVITLLFEMEGYMVMSLNNGRDFDQVIGQFSPDIVIMDVMLGDLDGRELCAGMKQNLDTSAIPIIMISASHDLQMHTMKEACRPNDFLAKPFDIDCLVDKVRLQLAG